MNVLLPHCRRILACGLVCIGMAGCTPSEDFLDSLFGIKHNTVVLARSPLEVLPVATTLSGLDAVEAVGESSSVCVVLAGNVSGPDSESEAHRLLDGAELRASITTSDGTVHEFKRQGTGWAMKGRVVDSNEITACVYRGCGKPGIPVGSKIRTIRISSTRPIHALGAYWQSTAAFDQKGSN